MKALLLAATSSLALTGLAMAQTGTPDAATTPTGPAVTVEPAGTGTDTATDVTTPAEAPGTMTTEVTTITTIAAPDVNPPVLSADNPAMLGSWMMKRRVWTTNQPSSAAWDDIALTERPADWTDIAKVDDIVVDQDGNLLGYVADIGGFLGIGAKQVLLGKDALHFIRIGDDAFFATNFTREELEALPDFDKSTVLQ